jgi:hypothetical protein
MGATDRACGCQSGVVTVRAGAIGAAFFAWVMASPAQAAPCVVTGTYVSLDDIRIGAGGAMASVTDVAITATIPRGDGPARVEVEGAIAFAGTRRRLWLTVKEPITAARGTVTLGPGAQVVAVRAAGSDVIASVVLHANDVLEGEDKPPDEALRAMRIPCRALTLDRAPPDADVAALDDLEPMSGGDGTWWRPRHDTGGLMLRARPDASAPRTLLTTPERDNAIEVERLAERGRWMRVVRTGPGVRVTGWVVRAALVHSPEGGGRFGMCTGDHGGGFRGRMASLTPQVVYEGPATIAVGTVLRSDDRPWATVRQPDGFEVHAVAGEPTVWVTAIPGVNETGLGTEVPAAAVTIPSP